MRNEYQETHQGIIGYGVAIILGGFVLLGLMWVLGIGFWAVTKPVNTAVGIVDRVIDADHALQSYRWFHMANQEVNAKVAQIRLQKRAVQASNEDRKEARRVALLGTQNRCQGLVGEYNAKALRADTIIFMHPEQFLPGNWPGERDPLPQSINMAVCE